MAGENEARPPLPAEPQECRQRAEGLLARGAIPGAPSKAIAWALLAVAGEVHGLRRELRKGR